MKIVIRPADEHDVMWLMTSLRRFDEFAGFDKSLIPEDFETFKSTIMTLINNHVFFVATENECMMGYICGVSAPHHFNNNIIVLTELLWWVDPEYRGTRAGLMLLEEFMKFGKENADWIVMTLEEKSPVKHDTLYKRGFRLQEFGFIHEVQH